MSIRRNTAYNLLGTAIPVAASFVTIPVYIELIGEVRYGVLAIAWLLLGYFGLFDLGLGRATAQRIAVLRDGSAEERAETFWTALAVNLGVGVIGGLLIWPIATYFFGHAFKIEDALRIEAQTVVPWLILAVPVSTLAGVLGGALQGRERFLELNLISVSGTMLSQILPLSAAAVWGPDLGMLLPVALIARLFTMLLLLQRCGRHIFLGHSVAFAREQVSHLVRFGGWVTVTASVGPMMVILDRFIIGIVSGAKAVTYYTVPFQLADRSTIISNALSSAIFPRFAVSICKEQEHLATKGLHALVVIMTPLVAAGILLIGPFLSWWITPAFAEQSTRIGQVLLLGFWANSFARIPLVQLQARGRPDLVAKCHLVEVLPYFGLFYLGLNVLGLVGAALAFSLRVVVDFALLSSLAGVLRHSLRMLATPALLLAGAYGIAVYADPGRPYWYFLAAIHQLIIMAWVWREAPSPFPLRQLGLVSSRS